MPGNPVKLAPPAYCRGRDVRVLYCHHGFLRLMRNIKQPPQANNLERQKEQVAEREKLSLLEQGQIRFEE